MRGLVLFDLDDTLGDRNGAFQDWAEAFSTEYRLGHGGVQAIVAADNDGHTTRTEFFERLKERFRLLPCTDQLIAEYPAQLLAHYRCVPDALPSLQRLREHGWKIGIVTNGPPTQEDKISRSGLGDSVDTWCVSEIFGVGKPDASIFEEAARRSGVPLRGWMVGDSPQKDIGGGARVGLRTIWLRRGRTWREATFNPEFSVESVSDAVDLVLTTDAK